MGVSVHSLCCLRNLLLLNVAGTVNYLYIVWFQIGEEEIKYVRDNFEQKYAGTVRMFSCISFASSRDTLSMCCLVGLLHMTTWSSYCDRRIVVFDNV